MMNGYGGWGMGAWLMMGVIMLVFLAAIDVPRVVSGHATTQDVADREPAHLCPACNPRGPSDADRGGAGQGL